MTPTEILMTEHRLIEQVLICLEKIVQQATTDQKLDKESALEAIDFCRSFADGCHHAKEEAHLFPVMEANGFSGGCSPVAVMKREHELARLYIQSMLATVEAASAGDPEAVKWFVQHAQSYVKLLREHIHKEDTCLFPAANHRLTENDQQQLLAAFEKIEAEKLGKGTHKKYHALANQLADRFGVPRVEADHSKHDSGCGCGQ
ncbi:MAG: hemerythrin domain-containing protein [Thermoguttaceae bacterium]|jgi:hemerythrin-like domain-containing protein